MIIDKKYKYYTIQLSDDASKYIYKELFNQSIVNSLKIQGAEIIECFELPPLENLQINSNNYNEIYAKQLYKTLENCLFYIVVDNSFIEISLEDAKMYVTENNYEKIYCEILPKIVENENYNDKLYILDTGKYMSITEDELKKLSFDIYTTAYNVEEFSSNKKYSYGDPIIVDRNEQKIKFFNTLEKNRRMYYELVNNNGNYEWQRNYPSTSEEKRQYPYKKNIYTLPTPLEALDPNSLLSKFSSDYLFPGFEFNEEDWQNLTIEQSILFRKIFTYLTENSEATQEQEDDLNNFMFVNFDANNDGIINSKDLTKILKYENSYMGLNWPDEYCNMIDQTYYGMIDKFRMGTLTDEDLQGITIEQIAGSDGGSTLLGSLTEGRFRDLKNIKIKSEVLNKNYSLANTVLETIYIDNPEEFDGQTGVGTFLSEENNLTQLNILLPSNKKIFLKHIGTDCFKNRKINWNSNIDLSELKGVWYSGFKNNNIEKIKSDTIEYIKDDAFENSNLNQLIIGNQGDKLTVAHAFQNTKLKELLLPYKTSYLDDYVFEYASFLKKVGILSSNFTLSRNTFNFQQNDVTKDNLIIYLPKNIQNNIYYGKVYKTGSNYIGHDPFQIQRKENQQYENYIDIKSSIQNLNRNESCYFYITWQDYLENFSNFTNFSYIDFYDNEKNYNIDDIVIYEDNFYIAKNSIISEEFNDQNWEPLFEIELIEEEEENNG